MIFDRGTFWVLPLTYFYLPKSARAHLFPQSVKIHYLCSGPISVDPISPQPRGERARFETPRCAREPVPGDFRLRLPYPTDGVRRSRSVAARWHLARGQLRRFILLLRRLARRLALLVCAIIGVGHVTQLCSNHARIIGATPRPLPRVQHHHARGGQKTALGPVPRDVARPTLQI